MALENTAAMADIIALLASMGVRLAWGTCMSLELLEKRVDGALELCQNISCLGDPSWVDPDALPRWSLDKPLLRSAARTAPLCTPNGSTPKPQKAGLSKKTETFKEMRQTLEFVAYACHDHNRDLVLITSDLSKGLFIKILGVYNVKEDIPFFFVLYRELVSTPQLPMADLFGKLPAAKDSKRPHVTISNLEYYAFLKLFKINARRLDPKHQTVINEKGGKKFQICVSFLLPLVPLSLRVAFKLSDRRCNTCGERWAVMKVCQGCSILAYCGQGCRAKDSHDLFCDILKGGTWVPITLVEITKRNLTLIPDRVLEASAKNAIESNHDDKVSLAQFTTLAATKRNRLMALAVFDQRGTFLTEWLRNEQNHDVFDAVVNQGGKKFFRWVRHISGDQYDLCTDKMPIENPSW